MPRKVVIQRFRRVFGPEPLRITSKRHFHEGRHFCHILNPLTGMPVTTWQSATIISALSIDSGSIATIAMLLGTTALEFLGAREERYLLVDGSGDVHSRNLGSFQKVLA
jgi:thiamine biosynthesis lipoprotein